MRSSGSEKKTRLLLFIGSAATLAVVVAFLVILNIREPSEYTVIPFSVLMIVTVIACAALAVFFAKGPVFDAKGRLESVNINAMLLVVLVIIQISFFFEIISVRNQILNYQLYKDIRHDYAVAESADVGELDSELSKLCNGAIKNIVIINRNGKVVNSSDNELLEKLFEEDEYTYPFTGDKRIRFIIDGSYNRKQMQSIILNLITVLVTSVFFSVEIVILMVRVIGRRMGDAASDEDAENEEDHEDTGMLSSLYYIRQISFLFYFASRLSSAFIPIMAKSLFNPFSWMSDNAAAGIPQSAETLLTCSAIFITTIILEKKGWKLPFVSGVLMVAAGTFLSAVSVNLPMFVFARAIVGLGYGFCWMTLRNLSLFGKDSKQQLMGFALLNAGIYAGMNCGSSLGAILADIFGYKIVFVISGVATLLTTVFIIRMENALLPHVEEEDTEPAPAKASTPNIVSAVLFVVLMIAPASIAASFTSYYLPLYFESIGKEVTDVGRAQLLYGIVIVYAGPLLSGIIARFKKHALKRINLVYNLLISLSLFLPGIGSGLLSSFLGSALLGTADSAGFGVQNNYFLALPAVERLGMSKSLSVLSFVKKLLEMAGPFVFAGIMVLGYQTGIKTLAVCFAVMAAVYMIADSFVAGRPETEKESNT